MSQRKKVFQHLRLALEPALSSQGFLRTARHAFYRDVDPLIHVLQIEFFDGPSHRVWGTTPHSFGISCGVFLKFAPNPFGGSVSQDAQGNLEPDATVCAIRTHLRPRFPQKKNVPPNVWALEADLSNMNLVARDALQVIESVGLPWFDSFTSVSAVLSSLQHGEVDMEGRAPLYGFGRKGSPVRNLYLGFAALAGGQRELAAEALRAALSKGGFAQLSGTTEVDSLVEKALAELTGSQKSADDP